MGARRGPPAVWADSKRERRADSGPWLRPLTSFDGRTCQTIFALQPATAVLPTAQAGIPNLYHRE